MSDAPVWKWWSGFDEERYTYGPFDTREDAVAEAISDRDDDQDVFVVEATKGVFPIPSASDLIGQFYEDAADSDGWSEDSPEPQGTKEQQDAAESDLDELLKAWFEKHRATFPEPFMFADTRNAETIVVQREETEETTT